MKNKLTLKEEKQTTKAVLRSLEKLSLQTKDNPFIGYGRTAILESLIKKREHKGSFGIIQQKDIDLFLRNSIKIGYVIPVKVIQNKNPYKRNNRKNYTIGYRINFEMYKEIS